MGLSLCMLGIFGSSFYISLRCFYMFLNKIQIQINTVLYLLKANSNIIEHTVHTSCYFVRTYSVLQAHCEKFKNSNLNSDQRTMNGSIPYFVPTRLQLMLPRHAQTQLLARSQKCKFEVGADLSAVF